MHTTSHTVVRNVLGTLAKRVMSMGTLSAVGQPRRLATKSRKKWSESGRHVSRLVRHRRMFVCLSNKETDHGTGTASSVVKPAPVPWNKGKLVGAKPPLRPSHVWSIRTKLQIEGKKRDLALFNLAIDSKLRGCDVVAVRVDDVAPSGYSMDRATIGSTLAMVPSRCRITSQ